MFDRILTRDSSLDHPASQRARMIEEQLRARGIHDERVLAAFAVVPREAFLAPEYASEAYGDHPVAIGAGQTISQPYMVASMAEALEVLPENRVLEIGTGTGYEAAILGQLATEVWSIERLPELARRAHEILTSLGYGNVHVLQGDGSIGHLEHAPYDRILVAAAAPSIPVKLVDQLGEGGRLVVPVGTRFEQQVQIVRKVNGEILVRGSEICRFVPLVGEQGWQS